MTEEYINNTSNARKVIDYISGMTDDFFLEEYEKLVNF
jgi:dGTP triphosphohydrolase